MSSQNSKLFERVNDPLTDINEAWSSARLKHITQINPDSLSGDEPDDWEIEYVDISSVDSIGEIKETERMPLEDAPSRAQRFVQDGDIIVSTVRTYLKAIAYIEEPPSSLVVSTGFAVIRPNDEIQPRFLWRVLQADPFVEWIVANSKGVSYPAINPSRLGDLAIPIPPAETQDAIVSFLDDRTARIDALIEKNQRLVELLEEKQSALVEKSVIEGTNEREFEANDRLEVLEEHPTGWDVRRAKTLFIPRDDRGHDDLPLLEVSLNHGVRLREENEERTAWVASDLGDMKRVAPGDIVYNKMRLWQGAVDHSEYEGLVSPDYTVLEPRPEANPEYYAYLLRTEAYKTEVNRRSYGLVDDRNRIYWKQFGDMPLLRPPREEQDEVVAQIQRSSQQIEELQNKVQEAIDLLKEKRQALITAAVTGQIDVTDGPEGE